MKFVNYFTGLYAWIFYGVIGQSLDKFKNNFNLVFDRPGNITVTGKCLRKTNSETGNPLILGNFCMCVFHLLFSKKLTIILSL